MPRVEWTGGILANGDYAHYSGRIWHAMTPNGLLADLREHEVEEHEDGTITVRPSILATQTRGGKPFDDATTYHGFLKRGVWSES